MAPGPRDKYQQCCYTRSYNNLAESYGFYFHARTATTICNVNVPQRAAGRTIPGRFGEPAARLLEYLDQRHYGLSLSGEDFHRVVLWLDCNSEFYGACEDPEAQAHGQLVEPSLH